MMLFPQLLTLSFEPNSSRALVALSLDSYSPVRPLQHSTFTTHPTQSITSPSKHHLIQHVLHCRCRSHHRRCCCPRHGWLGSPQRQELRHGCS
ncbi:hypothetical protein BXZ70DRAFT_932038 [Cristinia sonorae]|uniref:Uncharacterized protein n=1 Tax=Cristinia sonorae TaxID=1940300 RepID=A0A8K0URJ3_9AGAR|nr:hypothetical protein BXZ70DRAFT_932038 [Cristinia sonorae]